MLPPVFPSTQFVTTNIYRFYGFIRLSFIISYYNVTTNTLSLITCVAFQHYDDDADDTIKYILTEQKNQNELRYIYEMGL